MRVVLVEMYRVLNTLSITCVIIFFPGTFSRLKITKSR